MIRQKSTWGGNRKPRHVTIIPESRVLIVDSSHEGLAPHIIKNVKKNNTSEDAKLLSALTW